MNSRGPDTQKVTILLHDLPKHIEEGLTEQAAASGRDPIGEAAAIIERHVQESVDEII